MNSLNSSQAAFVRSLQRIVSPKIHFDGQIAKFYRTPIFEFCNNQVYYGRACEEVARRFMTRSASRDFLFDHLVGGFTDVNGPSDPS